MTVGPAFCSLPYDPAHHIPRFELFNIILRTLVATTDENGKYPGNSLMLHTTLVIRPCAQETGFNAQWGTWRRCFLRSPSHSAAFLLLFFLVP